MPGAVSDVEANCDSLGLLFLHNHEWRWEMPNFVDAFEPKRGDLVYGKSSPRAKYVKKLPEHKKKQLQGSLVELGEFIYAIDDYNDYFGVSGEGFVASARGEFEFDLKVLEEKRMAIEHLKGRSGNEEQMEQQIALANLYASKLVGSRYSPEYVTKLPQEKLKGNAKRDVRGTAGDKKARITYKAIRRACKFGIGMAAQTLRWENPVARIHFVLDGVDLPKVASSGQSGKDRFVAITTSEIRYVYRYWEELKGTVIFYVNMEQVAAPWEEDWELESIKGKECMVSSGFKAWESYGEKRLEKHKGVIPRKSVI